MKLEMSGVGFLLFVIFLILKLAKVIAWSWWWVTCPLWITFGVIFGIWFFFLAVAAIFFLGGVIIAGCAELNKKFDRD